MQGHLTTVAALAVAAVAAVLAAPGCKSAPDLRSLCDSAQRCIGGNDKDVDACVDQSTLAQKTADIRGCQTEFDDYAVCVADSGECTDSVTSVFCSADADCTSKGLRACSNNRCTTKTYGPKVDACKAEKAAYTSCNGALGALQ